jgi:hypothetical protein
VSADEELRALPVWQSIARASSEDAQNDLAAWLCQIRHAVRDGLDVRVGGNRETAEALRSEAVRSLRYVLSLGLTDSYTERARKLLSDIEADTLAVRVPGGMATVGWPSLAGTRGGAADADGALRGWLVRQIASMLPGNVSHRYKTVAQLVAFTGVECSQQLARSVLLDGRT